MRARLEKSDAVAVLLAAAKVCEFCGGCGWYGHYAHDSRRRWRGRFKLDRCANCRDARVLAEALSGGRPVKPKHVSLKPRKTDYVK